MQSRGHSPRTILYGRPTLSVHPRRAGVEARPYGGWLRRLTGNVISPHPRYTQPLSHAASRRDSSPFRGAEGVCKGLRRLSFCLPRCGYRGFPLARKGRRPRRPAVAGLPGWGGCRRSAWPIAPAFPTMRPVMSAATRIISRGHSPRTISYGRTHVIPPPTPGGRGSPPLRWVVAWVDGQRYCIAPTLYTTPQSRRRAPRQLPFQGSRGVGGRLRRQCACLPRC